MKRLLSPSTVGVLALAGLTLTASPASADVADRCTSAVSLRGNTWKRDTIPGARDVDWYKLTLGKPRRVRVVLGNLPANYAVELYSTCGNRIGASNRGSRYFEEMNKTLAPGTYRVKVMSKSGATSDNPYSLRFQSWALGRLNIVGKPRVQQDGDYLHAYVEVLNTSKVNLEYVKATVTYFNSNNVKIASQTSYAHLDMLAPMQRQSIEVLRQKPRGYHHARVRVVGQRTQERAEHLRVRNFDIAYQRDLDALRFSGTLYNMNGVRVDYPAVNITGYDKWGNITGQEDGYATRNRVAPRDTVGFRDFEYTPWGGAQWYTVYAQGI
jgi:hypothetical protein